MAKADIRESLRQLAADPKKRSKTAQIRELLDDIEAALAAGVSQADVVETLNNGGLAITHSSFKTTLKRLRDKRGPTVTEPKGYVTAAPLKEPSPPKKNPSPGAAETSAAPAQEEEPDATPASHRPQDLDKIIGANVDLDALSRAGTRSKKP